MERLFLTSDDGHQIHLCRWKVSNWETPRAVIHINHGMAEHAERYGPIALLFNDAGFDVVAHDHRGHGQSVGPEETRGYFADKSGWSKVLSDVDTVQRFLTRTYPHLPFFLHGQSMGSFIAQSYCCHYKPILNGVFLTGSAYNHPIALMPAKMVARLEKARQGAKGYSNLIHRLSFQRFNSHIPNATTEHDWLTRDPAEIQRYEADPLCGFLCTNQLWIDLLNSLQTLGKSQCIGKIAPQLPFYLVSGGQDPISDSPKQHGILALRNHLRSSGLANVDYKLYPGARHEILNELNRTEVVADIIAWLQTKL